jgi:hypothetical protein
MAKKTDKLGGATANMDDDFKAEQDASALTNAQEIRLDEKRHQAALKHMKKKSGSVQAAVDMEEKVKKGLAAAFPKDKTCGTCGKKSCAGCGGK